MPDDALIAETNRLLARVVEIHDEQKAESDAFFKEHDQEFAKLTEEGDAALKKKLEEKGLSGEELEGSEGDWEKRREAATRRSRENIETLRQRREAYEADTLAELRIQSELLRKIAERLDS